MTGQPRVRLERDGVSAVVLPDEGAALVELLVSGRPVLAETPWAPAVSPSAHPALTEEEWVSRWRGGWQLCFPSSGQRDPAAVPLDGFHGSASQAPWRTTGRETDAVALVWIDSEGLTAERHWRLTDAGAIVTTRVRNDGVEPRALAPAEHVILGGDVLAGDLTLDVPAGTLMRPLDYAGLPDGAPEAWPGDPDDRWTAVDRSTRARVTGLVEVTPQRVRARGAHVDVTVEWTGSAIPHALLWEELGASSEPPWNGEVFALGIEPTSTPHGAGTALDVDLVHLPPGETREWSVALSVRWTSPAAPNPDLQEES